MYNPLCSLLFLDSLEFYVYVNALMKRAGQSRTTPLGQIPPCRQVGAAPPGQGVQELLR